MVKIRPISKADLPACARILAAAYCRPPYRERLTLNFARRYLEGKYRSGRRQSFVALGPDKKVIGFQFVTLSAWSTGPQAIMEELAVDPKWQGRGIGTKLLNHTHAHLKARGVKSAMLWAKNDRRLPAWYKKLGYVKADYVVMFKNF